MSDGRRPPVGRVAARDARRRRALTGLAALVVIAIGVVLLTRGGTDDPQRSERSPRSGEEPPSATLALGVVGAPQGMLAVVGAGERGGSAIVLPPDTTIVAPGQGETTTEGIGALPGDSMRVAIANAVGTWIPHYAVLDLAGLAAATDRVDGLTVQLPVAVTTGAGVFGPGQTRLDGGELRSLLRAEGDDAGERWALVLEALLADPSVLEPGDLRESDDPEQALAALASAAGAVVELAPVAPVAASARVLLQPEWDLLVADRFGVPEPVRVLVQNGNGRPGIGEEVARRLLPNGFRVVISQNADNFRHRITEIAATDDAFADEAERAREALGTGEVAVSQVPSGLADITIVVGRDFRV